eukprot:COSAG01_NODE_312_length_19063_cov_207.879825_13_plen_114_part_00
MNGGHGAPLNISCDLLSFACLVQPSHPPASPLRLRGGVSAMGSACDSPALILIVHTCICIMIRNKAVTEISIRFSSGDSHMYHAVLQQPVRWGALYDALMMRRARHLLATAPH